jgi:hypothetical protein
MREIFTEIDIQASAATAWAILTDLERYSQWNPFMTQIKGKAKVGEKLKCYPQLPGNRRAFTFRPRVSCIVSERVFVWAGRLLIPGLADAEHFFEMAPLERGGIRLVHRQEYRGILVPLLWPLFAERTQKGFELMNKALKERAERMQSETL